ncbi:MAG TPA: carboxypeptidase-like regulatory domain-containing protein [Pyrinomonadaceae bacterium]|nr:carboxypeptidase-like regulatory domain-containing protein [Pyrinomonadaceae bacterium]
MAISLALCAGAALARQAAGSVRGRVADERGGVIVGAEVTLAGAGGVERKVLTDAEGVYVFHGLTPGRYALKVSAPGFVGHESEGVEVARGGAVVHHVTLTVALERQEVTVRSEADSDGPAPENNRSAIVLRGEELDALPDDPEALAAALRSLAGPSAGPDGGQIFVDGFTGGRLPPKSSIREVRINQNPFSAEFDRLGFGRIEVITRAGASRYEGSAFFNFNDESLNARNPFSLARAPFQSRRYGGNLSGPLLGKKSSFFADFERREIDDNAVVAATVLGPDFNVTPFNQTLLVPQRRTLLTSRFDRQLDPNNTLVARYTLTRSATTNAGVGDFSLPSRAYDTSATQQAFQLTESAVIKRAFINEVRFQFARDTRRIRGRDDAPAVVVLDAFVGGGSQLGLSNATESRWELADNLMFTRGRHTFRTGVRLRGAHVSDSSPQNFGGTFTFAGGLAPALDEAGRVVLDEAGRPVLELISSIERFRRTQTFLSQGLDAAEVRALGGGATHFSISGGDPSAGVRQLDVGAFVQDDWQVRPNLTLGLGLRYETQTNIDSKFNFAPRLSFGWVPGGSSRGQAKTVVRGGFGVFYSRFGEGFTLQANRFDGGTRQFIISDASVLDRYPSVPSADELAAFLQPQTVRRVAEDLRAPYSIQSALSVERRLPFSSTLTLTYLNLHTLHVLRTRALGDARTGARVYQYESSGVFNLHRLEVIAATRFNKHVSLNAAYGFGVAKGDTDGANSFPADSSDLSSEYGYSALDVRHRLFLTGTVNAPWGLRLSPLVVASSGRPFNITTGRDLNGDAVFTERPAFARDLTRPSVVVTPFGAFDPDPAPGQQIIPRNYGRGPSFFAVSLRASKTFRLNGGGATPAAAVAATRANATAAAQSRPAATRAGGERQYALSLSVQAWNLFNRANMNLPVGSLASPFFGRANSLAGSFGGGDALSGNRLVEFQVRLTF